MPSKSEAALLELMRSDRPIMNQRAARQAAGDDLDEVAKQTKADRDRRRRRAARAAVQHERKAG
jgi:hypothetical protein